MQDHLVSNRLNAFFFEGGKIISAERIVPSYAFVTSLQLQIRAIKKSFKRQTSDFSN